MTVFTSPEREGVHPWGPEANWQESAVLGWRDPVANVGGHQRMSIQPNRGTSNLWCGVYSGRETIYRLNLEQQPMEALPTGNLGINCGPQRMFHDGTNMRLQLDTPECRVDLIIDDYPGSLELVDAKNVGDMAGSIYREHFNLHCAVRGEVELDGKLHKIENGVGWRDHSWGPRDWSQVLTHRSFHGSIGPDFNFHLLTCMMRDGKFVRRGHIVRGGKALAIDTFTVRTEFLEDGVTPVQAKCLVLFPEGPPLQITAILQKGVFAEVENKFAFYGTGHCEIDGIGRGFADVEITNNPRGGEMRLGHTIGNVCENGLFQIDVPGWQYMPLQEFLGC